MHCTDFTFENNKIDSNENLKKYYWEFTYVMTPVHFVYPGVGFDIAFKIYISSFSNCCRV